MSAEIYARRPLRAARIAPVACLLALLGSCQSPTGAVEVPPTPRLGAVVGADGLAYTRIEAPVPEGQLRAEAVIGPQGGVLNLGPHSLIVPPLAVSRDTRITLERSGDGLLRFELDAVDASPDAEAGAGDPGTMVFRGGAFLVVSYESAINVMEDEDLVVLHEARDGGAAEAIHTVVSPGRRIALARLERFSRYCLASN